MSVSVGNSPLPLSLRRDVTPPVLPLQGQPEPCPELGAVKSPTLAPLLSFLETELALSPAAIALGLAQAGDTPSLLPMALWQFGLITLAELEQIFDWLEHHPQGYRPLP